MSFEGCSARLQITADEEALAALNNLWELYYLGKNVLYLFAGASFEPSAAPQRKMEEVFPAHLVLKLWKKTSIRAG